MTRTLRTPVTLVIAALLCAAATTPRASAQEEAPAAPAPAPPRDQPLQVEVTVKIIEFQLTKGVETGLSAYFMQLPRARPFGRVELSGNAINSADLTFPTLTGSGITVFLDRIRLKEGDIEVILQALVDENRAFILSEPTAQVKVGDTVPTIVKTVNKIPFESTQVVGSTAVQVVKFEETGVTLSVNAPEVRDADGDWSEVSQHNTYIRLDVQASVREEGQRLVVALDDQLASGGQFSLDRNAIQVSEFIDRSVDTHVWVRHGQVLMLGGLYRNAESNSLTTAPWATQGEDALVGLAERLIPGNYLVSPISASLGNRSTSDSRRELVFLIKAEIWDPRNAFTSGFGEVEQPPARPGDIFQSVIESLTEIPEGIAGTLKSDEKDNQSIDSELGGVKE